MVLVEINLAALYFAVYTNGTMVMQPTFEKLRHNTQNVLFYVRCDTSESCKYYHLLNSKGEICPLELNGGKLISIICKHSIIAFKLASPDRGIEVIDIYEQQGFYFPPLSISASLIKHLNKVGLKSLLGLE